MIIILGMDNSGKTTTVVRLSDIMGIPHVKSCGPISVEEQRNWICEQVIASDEGKRQIHERFAFFDEQVYGKVLRGKSNFELNDKFGEMLKKVDPVIVYCRPSNARIFDFRNREQYDGVVEEKEKLLMAFDELIFGLVNDNWKVMIYSFEKLSELKLSAQITIFEAMERRGLVK